MKEKENKNENSIIVESYPIDERPVIIILKGKAHTNYVGRYIGTDEMFMLSLNDESSDFIPATEVNEWWYINEHPTIVKEILSI
jgi:hypothetical protein